MADRAARLAGCPLTSEEDAVFEFEPGLFVSLAPDSKADLPNSSLYARPLDTSGYRTIANLFVAAMTVDLWDARDNHETKQYTLTR